MRTATSSDDILFRAAELRGFDVRQNAFGDDSRAGGSAMTFGFFSDTHPEEQASSFVQPVGYVECNESATVDHQAAESDREGEGATRTDESVVCIAAVQWTFDQIVKHSLLFRRVLYVQ